MKKRLLLSAFIAFVLCTCLLYFSGASVSAASTYDVIEGNTIILESGKSIKVPFTVSSKKYVMAIAWFDSAGQSKKGKKGSFDLIIKNYYDTTKAKDSWGFEYVDFSDGTDYSLFCLSKQKMKGQYYCVLKNTTNLPLKIKYSIRAYNKIASKGKFKKKVTEKRWSEVKIGKLKGGFPAVKSIKIGNKKIVSQYQIDKNGDIVVTTEDTGTTTITTTLKNGKKYKTKVTVKPLMPDVYAYMWDYDTRDNYFVVKIKNNYDKTITVYRDNGKVEHFDYKSYDRDFKKYKPVKIKPDKTKNVRFYLKGDLTWDDYKRYTLYSKIKCDGQTYKFRVRKWFGMFKKGKKWVDSYWDYDEFDEWASSL